MSIRDFYSSLRTGSLTPAEDSLRSELAEVVDQLVVVRHDFEHLRADRDAWQRKYLNEALRAKALRGMNDSLRELNTLLEEKLVAAEAVLVANGIEG